MGTLLPRAGSCLGDAAKLNSGCGKGTDALSDEPFPTCQGEELNPKVEEQSLMKTLQGWEHCRTQP